MNILLIPNNDWVNHPVPAQRHYKLFEKLGEKNDVHVLQFDIFKGVKRPTHQPKYTRLVRPFTIRVSNPFQFYAVNLPFQVKAIFSAIKDLDIEVIFGSNLAVCTAGFAVAKMYKVKTVFDLSDFFPSSVLAYPNAQGAKGKLIYDLATVITNANIRMVDLCTACSSALSDYAKCISPKTRVESLPNGVDTTVFTPRRASRRLKGSLGLDGEILTFVGSIESWLDFDLVFEALSLLKKEDVKVHLLIIGRSIYSTSNQNLMRKIRGCGLEDQVHFLGYQPYETVPEFVNLSCGGLIPFRTDNLLTRMAFPNKLLEYLACGKPVLAPPIGDMKRVGGRYLLEYTDPTTLALQIKRAISSHFDPYDIRKLVVDYDWNSIADRLQAFMNGLLN